jgi:transcriptional regulator with XRE-family HTH domain
MAPNRIADSLKAARVRVGWSREALAYHSGVSWSAIAQIESGRRTDVRVSTLSALAGALGVSVDHLIAPTASPPPLLEHRMLTYGSDDEFVAGAAPFLNEGTEQSHCLLAVLTEPKIELLRDTLGDRSDQVEFANWADWYRSPVAAVNGYRAFVNARLDAGASWIRVLGEAAWASDTDAEIGTWTRYESLVNLGFATSPVSIVCTYDALSFPEELLVNARATHPEVIQGSALAASPNYREPEDFLLEAADAFN